MDLLFLEMKKIMTDSNLPPHECYEKIILPYKGKLELWYQNKQNLLLDIQIIFMTVWIIIFPKVNFIKDGLMIYPRKIFKFIFY